MFEYFPDNYNWSLAVVLSDSMGGEMSEIDGACQPLRAVAANADDDALQAWYDNWHSIGRRAEELAKADLDRGSDRSASRKYLRAANYYLMAERQISNLSPKKASAYDDALRCFALGAERSDYPVEAVDVPFGNDTLPALFVRGEGADGTEPCLIMFNGFDVTKEYLYLMGVTELASRGFSLLLCDQPGSGGALRHGGLLIRHDSEAAASACMDYLESRPDVNSARVGVVGISMGGYFAPRAAAFEKRLRACVAWGALHNLHGVAQNLSETNADSVPDFQVEWVFGRSGVRTDAALLGLYNLDGVVDKIECPLLVLHGGDDRQNPLAQAYRTYEMATSSPKKELKVFPAGGWGDQHCQHDSVTLAIDYMGDWLADAL